MTWHYRVVRRPDPDSETGYSYGFHEAFYRCPDDHKPEMISEEPVPLTAESMLVFRKLVQIAMFRNVLDWETREDVRE
jgi:hypothetical protein